MVTEDLFIQLFTGKVFCDPGDGKQTEFHPGGGLSPSGIWMPTLLDSNGNLLVNGILGPPSTPTATLTAVASSTSSVQVLAANGSRKGAIFYNNSTSVCYLAYSSTASSSLFTEFLEPGSTFNMDQPIYGGIVSAKWVSANGFLQVTEL